MNWKHSFYQIYAISFGSSFLKWEALRILMELKEDREFAIASAFAESQRAQAKVLNAKVVIADDRETQANRMVAEAAMLETRARFLIAQPCLEMARAELGFIKYLIDYIDYKPDTIPLAVSVQDIQAMECAFDYAFSMALGETSADLLRNVYSNPYGGTVLTVVRDTQFKFMEENVKLKLSHAMASRLGLEEKHLSCTVNYHELNYLGEKLPVEMNKYVSESQRAQLALEELVNAHFSGRTESRESTPVRD